MAMRFLKFPAEEEQLIISQSAINKAVQVGDRVQIEEKMVFTILKFYKKKHNKKADIQSLMNRLRNKNN